MIFMIYHISYSEYILRVYHLPVYRYWYLIPYVSMMQRRYPFSGLPFFEWDSWVVGRHTLPTPQPPSDAHCKLQFGTGNCKLFAHRLVPYRSQLAACEKNCKWMCTQCISRQWMLSNNFAQSHLPTPTWWNISCGTNEQHVNRIWWRWKCEIGFSRCQGTVLCETNFVSLRWRHY